MKPNSSQLFADLAEKQRKIKANRSEVTLEEARVRIKWLSDQKKVIFEKRERSQKAIN